MTVLRLLLLLSLFATVSASARIFTRRSANDDIPTLLQQIGGRCAYSAPVRINGVRALLELTGFDDPLNLRIAEIRTALQLTPTAQDGDALYTIARAGKVTRLLLLRPAGGDKTLALTIEQTEAAYRQTQTREAATRGLFPLPLYPGATQGLQAENEDTGLYFTTLTSVAGPLQIADFYEKELTSCGWQASFQGKAPRSGLIYLKKNALCVLLILPENQSALTRITLLYKPFKGLTP